MYKISNVQYNYNIQVTTQFIEMVLLRSTNAFYTVDAFVEIAIYIHTQIHIYTNIHIYIYTCA